MFKLIIPDHFIQLSFNYTWVCDETLLHKTYSILVLPSKWLLVIHYGDDILNVHNHLRVKIGLPLQDL